MAAALTVGTGRGARRSGVLAELGAVQRGPVLGAGLAAGVLAALDLTVWADGPGSVLTWLSAALLGGAGALAFDRPAGTVTEATACPGWLRLAARLLVAAVGGAGWAAYAWAVSSGQPPGGRGSWTALLVIGAALIVTGPAAAVALSGPDNREPGALVASALVAVVVALLVVPLPGHLEPFAVADAWSGTVLFWSGVAALSVAVLGRGARR